MKVQLAYQGASPIGANSNRYSSSSPAPLRTIPDDGKDLAYFMRMANNGNGSNNSSALGNELNQNQAGKRPGDIGYICIQGSKAECNGCALNLKSKITQKNATYDQQATDANQNLLTLSIHKSPKSSQAQTYSSEESAVVPITRKESSNQIASSYVTPSPKNDNALPMYQNSTPLPLSPISQRDSKHTTLEGSLQGITLPSSMSTSSLSSVYAALTSPAAHQAYLKGEVAERNHIGNRSSRSSAFSTFSTLEGAEKGAKDADETYKKNYKRSASKSDQREYTLIPLQAQEIIKKEGDETLIETKPLKTNLQNAPEGKERETRSIPSKDQERKLPQRALKQKPKHTNQKSALIEPVALAA